MTNDADNSYPRYKPAGFENFGGTVRHAWDRPRNHSFASGTKWLAQAILPDAIKTGVDTACDEKSTCFSHIFLNQRRGDGCQSASQATLSDAIKWAWAWFTQTTYTLKTLFALSELSHCIDVPAPADLFIRLMVRLNSQPPNFTKESISTVVQWNEILKKCLHCMLLPLSDTPPVDNSLFKLLLDGLSHISRGQFWFGSTVMRSIDGNGVLQTQW
ncbi:hypothetical protein C8J57DRAFT_1232727 [Mycena rebaudengoi]|nr:hypothetical protein C8J57DRAFT_1232727 [Mycena rebaudengoi]